MPLTLGNRESLHNHDRAGLEGRSISTEELQVDRQIEHDIRPPFSQSTGFSASTPLPKPSASSLRRSTSLISPSKRNSRSVNRHASTVGLSQFTLNPLPSHAVTLFTADDTPTGAMRKLTGSSVHSITQTRDYEPAASRTTNEPSLDHASRPIANAPTAYPSACTHTNSDARTMQEIQGLLVDLVARAEHAKNPDFAALLEQSQSLVIESEKRAEAREQRLVKMLAEVPLLHHRRI